jgi:hypothetical protein
MKTPLSKPTISRITDLIGLAAAILTLCAALHSCSAPTSHQDLPGIVQVNAETAFCPRHG